MGARGPAPKPSKLNALRGNPGKRKVNKMEPQPAAAGLGCPAWLQGDARAEWERMAPELGRLGLLTVVDVPALAGYCQAYQRWREAEAAVQTHLAAGLAGLGTAIQSGLEGMARDRLRLMTTMAKEFGFTPASRSRVSAAPSKEEDPFEGFDGLKVVDGGKS